MNSCEENLFFWLHKPDSFFFFLSAKDQSELRIVCVCQSNGCVGSEGATKSNTSTPSLPLQFLQSAPSLRKEIHPVAQMLVINVLLWSGFDHKI